MKKSKFKTFIFRKKELITPKYILIMRELNSSLAPHLELWIVISLNFLKILYQKFLEKSNFQMVLFFDSHCTLYFGIITVNRLLCRHKIL